MSGQENLFLCDASFICRLELRDVIAKHQLELANFTISDIDCDFILPQCNLETIVILKCSVVINSKKVRKTFIDIRQLHKLTINSNKIVT